MDNKLETIEKSVVALHQLTENEKIKLLCQDRDCSMKTNYQKWQAAERLIR